jgi:uncharacterized protein (DUF2062 family)
LVDDGPPHMDEKPPAAPDVLPKEKPGIWTLWRRIWEIEGSPHAVAGGLAVGMFFGISPLWGLKTLLTLSTATVFRLNPLAAFLSLTAHDLLTPFVPVTLRLQYDLGYFLLSHPHHLPPKLAMADFHPAELMHWTTFFDAGLPLLVGATVVAIPSTVLTYFGALLLLKRRAERKAPRA